MARKEGKLMRRRVSFSYTAYPRLMVCVLFLPCFLIVNYRYLPATVYVLSAIAFLYVLLPCISPGIRQYYEQFFPLIILIDLTLITLFLYFTVRHLHALTTFYLLPVITSSFGFKPGAAYTVTTLAGISYILLAIKQGYWLVPIIFQIICFYLIVYYISSMNRQYHQNYALQTHPGPLTRVNNRRYFNYYLHKLAKSNTPHSLILLDIDNFKKLNDTQGHHHGDYILKIVAATLKEYSHAPNVVARYGGDEFALILPQTSKEDSRLIAEKIRNSILVNPQLLPYPFISVSLGIAAYPDDAQDAEELLEKVDSALYMAKERGKNFVYVYKNDNE